MKKLLLNTLKISAAAVLSVLSAQVLNLQFPVSAGIVAILSVQPTKKETLRTASARLFAFMAALFISSLLFNLLGFTVQVFFLYLALFILVCQWRGWISAMAMDSVLISHFLTFGKTGPTEILNEALLFALGVGFGMLVNIFLHKKTDCIETLKERTDELIRLTLHRMSLRILDPNFPDYDGSCFSTLKESLYDARKQAEENFNNQFTRRDTFDGRYVAMREMQTGILEEMFKCVKNISTVPCTASTVADFLEKTSREYRRDNDAGSLIRELGEIRLKMKEIPLPQDRNEFEDRAYLFMLLERLQEFLDIKNAFMKTPGNAD